MEFRRSKFPRWKSGPRKGVFKRFDREEKVREKRERKNEAAQAKQIQSAIPQLIEKAKARGSNYVGVMRLGPKQGNSSAELHGVAQRVWQYCIDHKYNVNIKASEPRYILVYWEKK